MTHHADHDCQPHRESVQPDEIQCILVLDLSIDNAITACSVTPHLPRAARRVELHLNDFGAERAPYGGASDRRTWRCWMQAVDAMLADARAQLGAEVEFTHYYLAGRAALPVFAYLGLRLGKQANITTVNRRDDGCWDVVPCQRPASSAASGVSPSARFFDEVRGLDTDERSSESGMVAVWVSTQRDVDRGLLRAFARARGDRDLAGIVSLRARPAAGDDTGDMRLLEGADGPDAARELVNCFRSIPNQYPRSSGLMVFVSGPVTLAAMVGRAINPRIHGPVWWPYFRGGEYEPALEYPWPLISGPPRILIATANAPEGENPTLDVEAELKHLEEALAEPRKRKLCEVQRCPAATVSDITSALRSFKPHILHFIGHGTALGVYLRSAEHDGAQFVRGEDFQQMIATSLRQKDREMHLVVLNACCTHELAKALTEQVSCTIGTDIEVYDSASIHFAARFYDHLVHGTSVHYAFNAAVDECRAHSTSGQEVFCLHPAAERAPASATPPVRADELVFFSPAERHS
ncbi:CHAT domain-containing protein [Haliangium ochraceum]|uniref:CHAT domain-containing protein n=2 Tax=Haliangium ochraceum TaxID=80816 RepID=D0LTI2_HALO1|nr:CHAT domain-containing protein [Haliangium ochraceum]ACY13877.1 hypothetical protein Hoch_1319 [Haliangium ochraceum DSM 14365]